MILLIEAALRSCLLTAVVWAALKTLRVRNPHLAMTVWIGVLTASLAMPLLMRLAPAQILPMPTDLYRAWAFEPATPAPPTAIRAHDLAKHAVISSWTALALPAYLTVAAALMARLGVGLFQGLRLVRRACRVETPWLSGLDVRLSPDLAVPVTIGGTILLPAEFLGWDDLKRRAVLAHEASHLKEHDFYLLLLASLHRALFWINPAAWWLHRELADLAEANSDDAALASLEDRLSYAEILVDLAGKARPIPVGVAMARPATLRRRIDRILTERAVPVRPTLRTLALVAAGVIPAALAAAGATTVPAVNEDLSRQRREEQARPRTAIALDDGVLANFVGYYALAASPELPIKVTREGGHLRAAAIGLPPLDYFPESDHKFFAKDGPSQDDFQIDAAGRVTALVLHQNGYELPAYRLDEAAGLALEKALAERIAANRPQPGSEAALRSHIDQLQRGKIDDRTLADGMAEAIRAIVPKIRPDMVALGPITAIRFQGVSPEGMDMYTVTHAHGARRWIIRLAHDGRIESMWFANL